MKDLTRSINTFSNLNSVESFSEFSSLRVEFEVEGEPREVVEVSEFLTTSANDLVELRRVCGKSESLVVSENFSLVLSLLTVRLGPLSVNLEELFFDWFDFD